jgi:ELWxxDGT repeat protein
MLILNMLKFLSLASLIPLLLTQTSLAAPLKLIKELPGNQQNTLDFSIAQNQTQLFSLQATPTKRELWRTDGTAQGTTRIKSIPTSVMQFFGTINGRAFFQVEGDRNPLWQTNSKTASPITAFSTGTIPFNATTVLGNNLLVSLQGSDGAELWTTNGTTSKRLKQWSYNSGFAWTPQFPTTVGNQTFFSMVNAKQQWRLGRTDGTTQGTIELPQVNPAAQAVTPGQNRVYFEGETPEKGFEWWTSDGTVAGTKLLKDILPGPDSSGPRMLAGLGDRFFALANSPDGYELWVTQGTSATTKKVKRIGDVSGMADRTFFAHQNKLFFAASNAFWVTDGTTAGTEKLANLEQVQNFVVFKDKLYFAATGPQGMELWTSDGTAAGTEQVLDIFPGTETLPRPCPPPPPIVPPNYCAPIVMQRSSSPSSLVVRGDRLYFIAMNPIDKRGAAEMSLWVSNGTSKGTKRVQPLRTGYGGSDRIIQVGAKLLVTGYDLQRQRHQIWQIPD